MAPPCWSWTRIRRPASGARDISQDTNAAATAIGADVSVSADVRRYVSAAVERGPIDAVAHAAGVTGPAGPLPDFDEAEFDRVMAVNTRGVFLGMKYSLRHIRDGGAIVNVASVSVSVSVSVSGIVGYPMVAAYVAPTHAVIGLTRTAALEGASRGKCGLPGADRGRPHRVSELIPAYLTTAASQYRRRA